jgi:hypothetical protein
VAKKSRTASRASRPHAKPAPSPVAEPIQRVFASKVTVGRATVDVPMLVLRGEWLKAIGFPIGATAFLSTDQRRYHAAKAWCQRAAEAQGREGEALRCFGAGGRSSLSRQRYDSVTGQSSRALRKPRKPPIFAIRELRIDAHGTEASRPVSPVQGRCPPTAAVDLCGSR